MLLYKQKPLTNHIYYYTQQKYQSQSMEIFKKQISLASPAGCGDCEEMLIFYFRNRFQDKSQIL